MGFFASWILSILFLISAGSLAGMTNDTFRVVTYNLENYLLKPNQNRLAKSTLSKSNVVHCLATLKPDVLAVQEIGGTLEIEELASALKSNGLELTHLAMATVPESPIQVGVLSRFPFKEIRLHTNDLFLLNGRRFKMSRGIVEVEIMVRSNYHFFLFTGHLKSKRTVPQEEEFLLREEEAKILRKKIDQRLQSHPRANLVVLGDFNDTYDSTAIKLLIGRGNTSLLDTKPVERTRDFVNSLSPGTRRTTWTHHYQRQDIFSRIDYVLLSHGMIPEWIPEQSFVANFETWGLASDHRPVVATFLAIDQ